MPDRASLVRFWIITQGDMIGYQINQRQNILRLGKKFNKPSLYLLAAIVGASIFSTSLIGCQGNHGATYSDAPFEQLQPQIRKGVFFGSDWGWIIDHKTGDLWRTENAGRDWKKIAASTVGGEFNSVGFLNSKKGWAVGGGGTIWQSDDGGNTWTRISTLESAIPNKWSFISAEQLKFTEDSVGWIVDTSGIWRTEDGGHNWRRVLSVGDPGITSQPVRATFLKSSVAIVNSADGKVYRTEDNGNTWQVQTLIQNGSLKDTSFVDEENGWITGYGPPKYNDSLYRSADGGRTWKSVPIIDRNISIYSIQFVSKFEGWAVGVLRQEAEGRHQPSGIVMHTNDAGESWEQIKAPDDEQSFEKVHFVTPLQGWLISRNKVYRTENGGKTWSKSLGLASAK